MLGAGGTGRGEEESSFDVTAGISMVELEFAVVEFMISSLEGVYTSLCGNYKSWPGIV
jgi:hypothetical protein